VRISLRSKDIENVDEKLKQIEAEIANVKAELPAENSEADTPEKSSQDILDNVRAALEAHSADIAQMIVNKEDKESIKAAIVSIVRSEIIRSLKEESEQYSTALGEAVQHSVQDLATIEIDSNAGQDLLDVFDSMRDIIGGLLSKLGGIWGKIAALLLPFLPQILNWLFGKSEADIVEEVRQGVMGKCADEIISAIQPTIYKITVDNQKRIQESIQAELVSKMEKVKEGMREKLTDAKKSKEEVQAELAKLNDAISHLEALKVNI
jgi:hypothetical protein